MFFNRKINNKNLPQSLEEKRKALSNFSLKYNEEDHLKLGVSNFKSWIGYTVKVRDPDKARAAIYAGFQPLLDALIDDRVCASLRPVAVKSLDDITKIGIDYLTSYYLGEPNLNALREGVALLADGMNKLGELPYLLKFRNVDYNRVYVPNILSFLQQSIDYSMDGKFFQPEYILGSACGASEVVMPLAGILGVDLGFIRWSKRREDDCAKFVKEHEDRIRNGVNGKKVVVIEDWVDYGITLKNLLGFVSSLEPQELRGASIINYQNRKLKELVSEEDFNLYKP